jgi:uncharacterized protein (TIGR02145 family)
MNFFKNYKRTLLLTAVLTVGAIYWSGCSNPANSSGGNIVCKDGEAWIIDGTDGGYIFAPNGEMRAGAAISDGRWYDAPVGTYSASGDKLTTIVNGETKTTTYKVSGDKLTLSGEGDPVTFTKRSVVNVDNNNNGKDSYEFVSIGGNRWMNKNLNIETADSWCYGDGGQAVVNYWDDYGTPIFMKAPSAEEIQSNCKKYGRLYTWEAAKTACQSGGMRLPSSEDWGALVKAADSSGVYTATKLMSKSWWDSDRDYDGIVTNETRFSALPAGIHSNTAFGGADGDHAFEFFADLGKSGYWWTATEGQRDGAEHVWMTENSVQLRITVNKGFGLSVRCVEDV